MNGDKIPESGIYRHYGGHEYLVLGVARHHDTDRLYVVYIPLYNTRDHPKGPSAAQMSLRELDGPDGWNTPVQVPVASVDVGNFRTIERFEKVRDC